MKFGSPGWFEKLNKMISFPAKFSFYYNKKDNIIQVTKLDSKAKIENVRYKDIEPSPMYFHPVETALITVKEISSGQEYHDEIVRLNDVWGTSFTD